MSGATTYALGRARRYARRRAHPHPPARMAVRMRRECAQPPCEHEGRGVRLLAVYCALVLACGLVWGALAWLLGVLS